MILLFLKGILTNITRQYKLCSDYIYSRKFSEFLHSAMCWTKMQLLQGLVLDESLIPGLCHLTTGCYFTSEKTANAMVFLLLFLTVVDIT